MWVESKKRSLFVLKTAKEKSIYFLNQCSGARTDRKVDMKRIAETFGLEKIFLLFLLVTVNDLHIFEYILNIIFYAFLPLVHYKELSM